MQNQNSILRQDGTFYLSARTHRQEADRDSHFEMPRAKTKKEEPVEPGSDVVMDEAPTSHQPESRDDMSVDEDENDEVEVEDNDAEEEDDVQRVRLVCRILLSDYHGCVKISDPNERVAPWLNAHRRLLRVSQRGSHPR
jgi:hypothetical protein